MEINLKENGNLIKRADMDCLSIQMILYMKDSGAWALLKVKEL